MHAFVSKSMAVLLLIQALSGSCWQPARECTAERGQMAKPARCCEHGCPHDERQVPAPCKCPRECHGICTYVIPEKSEIDRSDVSVAFDSFTLPAATAYTNLVNDSEWQFDSGPAKPEPAVRLHLFHQVLLI
jgi:hypothetical protein